jgi:hypothetical protein
MKKLYFTILIISGLTFTGLAQDRIIKTTKDTIVCQVKEIGDDEIKYTQKDFKGDVIFGIDKNKVDRIVFSDGKELKFNDSMYGSAEYAKQKKNALKVGFLSPLFGATSFSYEHSLKPGSSIEATLGIIGLGSDISGNKASGAYLKFGYKFIKSPDYYQKGTRFEHILKGAYLRPEIAFSTYSAETTTYTSFVGSTVSATTASNTMFAVLLNTGKQWVIYDKYIFDWFVGVGYGFGSSNSGDAMHYAFLGGSSGSAFAVTSGIKIGVLF